MNKSELKSKFMSGRDIIPVNPNSRINRIMGLSPKGGIGKKPTADNQIVVIYR